MPSAPAKCAVELLTVINTSKFFSKPIHDSISLNKSKSLKTSKCLFCLNIFLLSESISPYCKLIIILSSVNRGTKSLIDNDFKLPYILTTLFQDNPILNLFL